MVRKLQYWKTGEWVRSVTLVGDDDGYELWSAMKAQGWNCFVYEFGTTLGTNAGPAYYCVEDYDRWKAGKVDAPTSVATLS